MIFEPSLRVSFRAKHSEVEESRDSSQGCASGSFARFLDSVPFRCASLHYARNDTRFLSRSAFTLLELLVVLAIVGILAALIYPAYNRVVASGRAGACVSNLRQLGAALNLYLGEHDMTMPMLMAGRSDRSEELPVIDNTLDRYARDSRVFACPADANKIAEKSGTSYYWNAALSGQHLANLRFLLIADPGHIPILADKEGFHPYEKNKVNLLYADGHATKELTFFTN